MNDIARDLHALIDDAEELLQKGAREAGDASSAREGRPAPFGEGEMS